MTIEQRIAAQQAAVKDATTLSQIAAKLRKANCTVEFKGADGYGRDAHVQLKLSCWIDASQGHFSTHEAAADILPHFQTIGKLLDECVKRHANLFADVLEEKASALISPTVTIQSNGVNVEVK